MNDLIDGVKIEGECLIDGKDIYGKSIKIDELRKRVGMVFKRLILSQKPFLKM